MGTTSTTGGTAHRAAGCGEPVAGWESSDKPLAMTASFPARVAIGTDEMLRGTVTVTNRGDEHLRGITAAHPEVTVARDGTVVALPVGLRLAALVIDLPPAASQVFDAVATLRPCDAGAEPDARLPPGDYQLFASQQFDLDHPVRGGGNLVVVRGGPWEISLV